jgi:hypothetical protein
VLHQNVVDAVENRMQRIRVGQRRDPEVIRVFRVETAARCNKYVTFLQQLERKLLVGKPAFEALVQPDKRVHRPHGRNKTQVRAARDAFDDALPGLVQAPAGLHEFTDTLEAAERRLYRPLPGDIAAQAQCGE